MRLLLAGVVLVLLSACGPAPEPEGEAAAPSAAIGGASGTELAAEQILRKGNGSEPQTLDPHRAEGVPASNILRDLYEGLTMKAPNGDVIPGAAESWTISDDGLVYTFTLRPDGRWSNGDPVTAADFEYGLRRSVDPATLSSYSSILYPILNAEAIVAGDLPADELGVKALDERTLEIRLNAPTPYLLGLMTHSSAYPVHQPSVEEHGGQFARPGKLVGNGAYLLSDWVVQSHITLKRNSNYWDNENTTIEEVWYYGVENQDAELKRYRAGELDFTYELPYKQLTWIRENRADELVIAPYLGSYYFGYNLTKPPFRGDLNLRLALSLAIDRDIITGKVTGAGEIPAYSWVPPVAGYEQAVPEYASWTQEERLAEAKRLYAEAGYSEENPLTVDILYNTNQNHKRIAAAIAAMWKQSLGVTATLTNQEWKVFLDTRKKKEITQVFRSGWIGDYNDAYTFAQLLHSLNGQNDPGYNSPEYDDLLDRAAAEPDVQKRAQLMHDAEVLMLADAPIIPIYFYVTRRLVQPWVAGFEPNIMDHHHSKDWKILKH